MSRVEADEHGVPWLIDVEGVRYQLAVVFQGGCIVSASPEEQAVSNAHVFGSGRLH